MNPPQVYNIVKLKNKIKKNKIKNLKKKWVLERKINDIFNY